MKIVFIEVPTMELTPFSTDAGNSNTIYDKISAYRNTAHDDRESRHLYRFSGSDSHSSKFFV